MLLQADFELRISDGLWNRLTGTMVLEGNLAMGRSSILRILGKKSIYEATETKGLKCLGLEGHKLPQRENKVLPCWDTESNTCFPFLSLLLLNCNMEVEN